jgi:hypothetical protein
VNSRLRSTLVLEVVVSDRQEEFMSERISRLLDCI